jgi:hypothetical protein
VQVIACFLWGNVMEQLYAKWDAELQDGCVVVSNVHPMPHWPPVEVISVTEWAIVTFVTRAIYAYRLPEARTRGQAGRDTLRAADGVRTEPSAISSADIAHLVCTRVVAVGRKRLLRLPGPGLQRSPQSIASSPYFQRQ